MVDAPMDVFAEAGITDLDDSRQKQLKLIAALGTTGQEMYAAAVERVKDDGDVSVTTERGPSVQALEEVAFEHEALAQAQADILWNLENDDARYNAGMSASADQLYQMAMADKSGSAQMEHARSLFDIQSETALQNRREFQGIPGIYDTGSGSGSGDGMAGFINQQRGAPTVPLDLLNRNTVSLPLAAPDVAKPKRWYTGSKTSHTRAANERAKGTRKYSSAAPHTSGYRTWMKEQHKRLGLY